MAAGLVLGGQTGVLAKTERDEGLLVGAAVDGRVGFGLKRVR